MSFVKAISDPLGKLLVPVCSKTGNRKFESAPPASRDVPGFSLCLLKTANVLKSVAIFDPAS